MYNIQCIYKSSTLHVFMEHNVSNLTHFQFDVRFDILPAIQFDLTLTVTFGLEQ